MTRETAVAAARGLTVAAGFGLGALLALGCLVAAMLEADGFGAPGGEPRPAYLAALAIGLTASLAAPVVLLRLLLPRYTRAGVLALLPALLVAWMLLGLSL